jgi:predicted nuclease with TOPRIM domain
MSTITENDLKELKELINSRFDTLQENQNEIKRRLTTVETQLTDLRVNVGKIESTLLAQQPLVQKIPDLAERVGELKNWKQIVVIVVTASVGGLIG